MEIEKYLDMYLNVMYDFETMSQWGQCFDIENDNIEYHCEYEEEQLKKIISANAEWVFEYDDFDRVILVTKHEENHIQKRSFEYDNQNNPIKERLWIVGKEETMFKDIQREYNICDLCIKEHYLFVNKHQDIEIDCATEYQHALGGNVIFKSEVLNDWHHSWEYSNKGSVISEMIIRNTGYYEKYIYDNKKRIICKESSNNIVFYSYDENGMQHKTFERHRCGIYIK